MKPLRHLLIVAYMLGMMHEFIPHEHHGEARDSAIHISEVPAAESGSLWRHLKALGALSIRRQVLNFFYAPERQRPTKLLKVSFRWLFCPRKLKSWSQQAPHLMF